MAGSELSPNPHQALSGREKELLAAGVTVGNFIYLKGMPFSRESFELLASRWEIELTLSEIAELFSETPLGSTFLDACRERGFLPATTFGTALSARQMVALSKASNVLDRRPLSRKLLEVGVQWWEWQTWLANPAFGLAYREQAELNINRAQATVLDAMTANAAAGDLKSIEYFNKLSGRFNPAQQAAQDTRVVLNAFVEIIQEELKGHPEIFSRVASRLSERKELL